MFFTLKGSNVMNKCARTIALLAVAILLAGQAFAAGEVGTPGADFTLDSLDGGTETLSHHLGDVVLLNMFGYG
jgi:hypothetical protein